MRGGLSDGTSNNGDGQSMRSQNEILKTPSSMMGSHGPLNTSQYLLTSPIGQQRDTAGSITSAGQRPIKSMLKQGEAGMYHPTTMSGQKSQFSQE